MKAIHRWQPTGYTPCGRPLDTVVWNEGKELSEGVTCKACRRATTRVSFLGTAITTAPYRETPHVPS